MSTPQLHHYTVIIEEIIQYSYEVEAADRDAAIDATRDAISDRGFAILSELSSQSDFADVLHHGPVEEVRHV